jgi:Zn-dependent M32 family carboxypeptidase
MDELTTLRERLAEISDLSRASGVLGWEQRVTMPPLGTESRAESLAPGHPDRFTDRNRAVARRLACSRSRRRTTRTTRA